MIAEDILKKFGYPESVVKEYAHWYVMLGPVQITLGTLILAAKDGVTSLSELSKESFSELAQVIYEVEHALRAAFQVDRFNYLWLMMATREVHAAIIPRYSGARQFQGVTFSDPGWPKKPDLDFVHAIFPEISTKLVMHLKEALGNLK